MYSPDGITVQNRINHKSGACCVDAPIITRETTVGTAAKNATIVSGPAGASILSNYAIFNTNLLTSFQRINAPKLPCLSYLPLLAYPLEWNGGGTGGHYSSQPHPSRKSFTPIPSVSGVDVTRQCSALTQATSERPMNVHTPFDLELTPTG